MLGAAAEAFVETKILYAFLGVVLLIYVLAVNWDAVVGEISSRAIAAQAVQTASQNGEVLPEARENTPAAMGAQNLPDLYVNRGRDEGNVMTYEHD